MTALQQIIDKSLDAANGGIGALSAGEALTAAFVLNRPDWIFARGYTLAQAVDRVGREWMSLIPEAARQVSIIQDEANEVIAHSQESTKIRQLQEGDSTQFNAKLVTFGNSPGYRDVSFVFDLQTVATNKRLRAELYVKAEDGLEMMEHIRGIHEFVWRDDGNGPIDRKPGENKPRWLVSQGK